MTDRKPISIAASKSLQSAISRWENEGGAGPCGSLGVLDSPEARSNTPPLTDAELVQLRIRVIALENLMIAMLATASDEQLVVADGMSAYISPRSGFTHHPLTLHAAALMTDLIERARRFRLTASS